MGNREENLSENTSENTSESTIDIEVNEIIRLGRLAVAYPEGKRGDGFISRHAYEYDYLRFLSRYVPILAVPVEYLEAGEEFEPDPDYLMVNIDIWGLKMFELREQGKIHMPFLVYFHVIFGQDIYISYILPMLREDDILLVASDYSRQCLKNISDHFNAHIIPLGLDIEEIERQITPPEKRDKEKKGKTIGFLGQLIPEKGIDQLIEAMPEIIEEMKKDVNGNMDENMDENMDGNITLTIIGPLSGRDIRGESSEFVAGMQKRTMELGIAEHVNWTGVLLGDEKYRALSCCDIFVNPSVFRIETFGVVNTEALACGLPVICTRWSAFPEVITEGKNGFFLEVQDDETGHPVVDRKQLVSLVTGLLKNEALLEQMKREARKTSYNYDYRKWVPQIAGKLRKKEGGKKGRWEELKDQTFLEYRHLFKKEWLEVIGADRLDYKTYEYVRDAGKPGVTFPDGMRDDIFRYLSGSEKRG
jgi:glycosyltransferase involved in cell wall biosynthesis